MRKNGRKIVQSGRQLMPPVLADAFMNKEENHRPGDDLFLIQRLQLLHSHVITNHEKERDQMAAYLNDTAVQSLSALHMQLSLLLSKPQLPHEEHKQLADTLPQIMDLVDGMMVMARGLRPLELNALGLNAMLQQASEEFSNLARMPVNYEGLELAFLPESAALAFYRLTQEAFVNVLKHAQATQTWVTLQADGKLVNLTIQDNGQGFETPVEITNLLEAPGLGLFGLMVQFQQLNGRVTIQSRPGKGTTVKAVLPYP